MEQRELERPVNEARKKDQFGKCLRATDLTPFGFSFAPPRLVDFPRNPKNRTPGSEVMPPRAERGWGRAVLRGFRLEILILETYQTLNQGDAEETANRN